MHPDYDETIVGIRVYFVRSISFDNLSKNNHLKLDKKY